MYARTVPVKKRNGERRLSILSQQKRPRESAGNNPPLTGPEDTGPSDNRYCTMFVALTAHRPRSRVFPRKHFRRVLRRVPFTY